LGLSKEPQNKEKEQEKRNSQNIGFSFSFWRPPTKKCEKGKCNQAQHPTDIGTGLSDYKSELIMVK